ncbi:MAG TPA: methyltransferase [Candidatus Angelobacter sp.]|nr:methyltransferase [Candidatus Angelobacter sp.]
MSDATLAKAETAPPEAQLAEMMLAQFVSRLIYLAATLKLSDYLVEGPRTAAELASLTGTHAPSLHRVLRTLSSLGLFTEDSAQRFSLQPLGAALKSGTPSHAAALILTGEIAWRSLDHFLHSVQTGETGFQEAFGMPVFDWLAGHPAEASLFNGAMVGFHGMEPAAVAAAYDFSDFQTIADVGGSTGNMLTTILAKHAGPRGILYDMPHVVRDAPAIIQQRGLTDRIQVEAGSFFESVPAGANAYVLSHIIHDWNEEQCLTILGNCRRAMNAHGRVLLIEMVLPGDDAPHPGKMLDMVMLTITGGQERTAAEYRQLLDKAGFRLTRVVPTSSPVSIVEATPR